MLGMTGEAVQQVGMLRNAWKEHDILWVRQRLGFFAADLLLLTGARADADAVALEVAQDTGVHPLSSGEIGRAARWTFRLRASLGVHESFRILEELAVNGGELEFLDQAELLGSLALCREQLGLDTEVERRELSLALSRLPEPVTTQLSRLEALD